MTTMIDRRRVLFAGAAGVGLAAVPALGGGMAAAAARTAPVVSSKVAPGTFVTLNGALNTRDLGGYTTSDGKKIKGGKIFRSGTLSGLTATGVSQLNALNVKWSIDLRDDAERYLNGKNQVGSARPWISPCGNDAEDNPFGPPVAGQVTASVIAEYESYVTASSNVIATGSVVRMLAIQGGVPLIYNCDSGSNRTGWTTAVLMTVLGVPRTQVNSEYLLSNGVLGGQYLFTDYLDAAFNKVNELYGDWATYVQIGLGLDAGDITALKSSVLN